MSDYIPGEPEMRNSLQFQDNFPSYLSTVFFVKFKTIFSIGYTEQVEPSSRTPPQQPTTHA